MPNEPYVEEIMVADGDGDHPSTEEVKYEEAQISDDVIGVKGNDETSYRNGYVNITQDNIVGNNDNDTDNISDSDLIIFKKNSDSKWYRKAFSKIWDYIKSKIGIATSGDTFLKKDGTWATPTDTKYPKAVKNITRSGLTFTATCYDDTTFTFTQQDNDTKKGNGITTNAAKTGTAQSSVTTTIAANTTMDDAFGTLLNNDVTLNSKLSNVGATYSVRNAAKTLPKTTNVAVCSLSVPAGTYIVSFYGRGDQVGYGYRVFAGINSMADVLAAQSASSCTGFCIQKCVTLSSAGNINGNLYCENDGSIGANIVTLTAVRVK